MTAEPEHKIHPFQRAWAGGVFDCKVKFPRSGYVLRFDSIDEGLLKRFHDTVKVGNVLMHEKRMSGTHHIWIYQTGGMDATRELLLTVAPFLTARKLKQASEMLARIERSPDWRRRYPEKAKNAIIEVPKGDEGPKKGRPRKSVPEEPPVP